MLRRKKSKADKVKDKAAELQEKATETLGPKASDAREAAESAFGTVREDIAPKIREEIVSAIGSAEAAVTSSVDEGASKVKKKKEKKRGGKLKKLVIVAGLGGVAYFVTKKVKESQSGPPVPPPAPRPTPAPSPATPPRPSEGQGTDQA